MADLPPIQQLPDRLLVPPVSLQNMDRVTGQVLLHHEHKGSKPTSTQNTFSFVTTNIVQPYVRRLEIGADFVLLLQGCWVEKVGLVIIENTAGKGRTGRSPLELQEAVAEQVLELAISSGEAVPAPFAIVRPGLVSLLEFTNPESVVIRSRGEPIEMNLMVIPQ